MPEFKRITKREARQRFADGKPFFLCPVNLRPGFPWSPHSTVAKTDIAEFKQAAENCAPNGVWGSTAGGLWKGDINSTAWDFMYNAWAFYNASHEAGYYAAYYLES